MNLTSDQQSVIDVDGHILVEGGPGSGKTTVALLKAAKNAKQLHSGQKILFLSFSRAAVVRVFNAIESLIDKETAKKIEVNTYHSFFWKIIKTHGYLLGVPRVVRFLNTGEAAAALASFKNKNEKSAEKWRLCKKEGLISFDCFADLASEILRKSASLSKHYSDCFPLIFLDEFQDTLDKQWDAIKSLGQNSKIIALCDNEQRIHGWIPGASKDRPQQFASIFTDYNYFNLASNNHRSSGTDIAEYGNAILDGSNRGKIYNNVCVDHFSIAPAQAIFKIKRYVLDAINRQSVNPNWSVAVLTPEKKQVRKLSQDLNEQHGSIPPIKYSAIVDMEGITLAAEIIAYLLQPSQGLEQQEFIRLLCTYLRGRKGDKPNSGDLSKADQFEKESENLDKLKNTSQLKKVLELVENIENISLSGNPEKDWLTVRNQFKNLPHLKNSLIEDARDIPLLGKGKTLSANLVNDWQENGSYKNALTIVKNAFLMEHMDYSGKIEKGVVITNIDKSKGKQFSEVIIIDRYPSTYFGALVHGDTPTNAEKMRFRVAVTRAEKRVTILTPLPSRKVSTSPLLFT